MRLSPLLRQRRVVFSGIQPTGALHLGNYFGAVQKWLQFQDQKDTQLILSVVDLHAITLDVGRQKQLRNNIREMSACLLACGFDPDRTILFQQSRVPQHGELAWILGCISTVAQLQSLPQYKDKSVAYKDGSVPLGLLTYPVLQAADILLYKATDVPVGEDQQVHLNWARHWAKQFNHKYKVDFFPEPQLVLSTVARLKSLRHPDKKMSKSDPNSWARLELCDDDETMRNKIKRAVTDSNGRVTYEQDSRPGVSNLITLHSAITGITPEDICVQNSAINTGQYKMVVADAVIEKFAPIRERYLELLNDPPKIARLMETGAQRASEIASKNMTEIKQIVGFE